MDLSPFDKLPDEAQLWVYAFERPLSEDESRMVAEHLDAFMEEWHSHEVDVTGAFAIFHDRFVILAGASTDSISGCSIDSSVANFKHFRDHHGLNALNRNLIFYRDNESNVTAVDRGEFQDRVKAGDCGADTIVFDPTVPRLGELRAGRFELPVRDSWHGRAFLQTQSR